MGYGKNLLLGLDVSAYCVIINAYQRKTTRRIMTAYTTKTIGERRFKITVDLGVSDFYNGVKPYAQYYVGTKAKAISSAIQDILAMSKGAVFKVQQWSSRHGYISIRCGENVDGEYYERCNY
jgi:hypothetical protein